MNDDERIYKEYVSQTFNRAAPSYDRVGPRFFSYFGNRLVELAGVWSGASVLDLGCGRGAILFPAADKVGASGEVIGIDITETMLQSTSSDIESLGIKNVKLFNLDADTHQERLETQQAFVSIYELPQLP